jgi:hypothetical protein
MARWFDLHLYYSNWGSRRLMIRLPKRFVDRSRVEAFLDEVDCVSLQDAGDNVIVDIERGEIEAEDWDDGVGLAGRPRPAPRPNSRGRLAAVPSPLADGG